MALSVTPGFSPYRNATVTLMEMQVQFYSLRQLSRLADASQTFIGTLVRSGAVVADARCGSQWLFSVGRLETLRTQIDSMRQRRKPKPKINL